MAAIYVPNPETDLEEAEVLTQVDSRSGRIPFQTLTFEGLKTTGHIVYRDYEGSRELRRMYLVSGDRNYRLGVSSGSFRMTPAQDVFGPWLDAGFEPGIIKSQRGGSKVFAVLYHPEIFMPDQIHWDLPTPQDMAGRFMNLAVGIRYDARVGHGFEATAGFFRTICTNGLIAEVLHMGQRSFTHLTFKPDKYQEFALETVKAPEEFGRSLPEPAFHTQVLPAVAERLMDPHTRELPAVISEPFARVTGILGVKATAALAEQFQLISSTEQLFSSLDLLNAVTNASSSQKVHLRIDTILLALTRAIQLEEYRSGLLK